MFSSRCSCRATLPGSGVRRKVRFAGNYIDNSVIARQ
jgi:hypothetical protein